MEPLPVASTSSAPCIVNDQVNVGQSSQHRIPVVCVENCTARLAPENGSELEYLMEAVFSLPPEMMRHVLQNLTLTELMETYWIVDPGCKEVFQSNFLGFAEDRAQEKVWRDLFFERTIDLPAAFYLAAIPLLKSASPALINAINDEGSTALITELILVDKRIEQERWRHQSKETALPRVRKKKQRPGQGHENAMLERDKLSVSEHLGIIDVLLQEGAGATVVDEKGRCALGLAVKNDLAPLVSRLLMQPDIHLNIARVMACEIRESRSNYIELLANVAGFDLNAAVPGSASTLLEMAEDQWLSFARASHMGDGYCRSEKILSLLQEKTRASGHGDKVKNPEDLEKQRRFLEHRRTWNR